MMNSSEEKDFCCMKLLSKGRIGRTHYFLCTLGISIFGIILAGLLSLIPTIGTSLAVAYFASVVVFNVFLTIQRCHDINISAWLSLAVLVPFLSPLFYIIPGTKGENPHGQQPSPCCSEAKAGVFVITGVITISVIAILLIQDYSMANNMSDPMMVSR